MWNNAAQKTWKEVDQDVIAEKSAIVSSSEVLGNHPSAKRQRRPSVRLEDIGNRPAALVAEKKKKKIVFFASSLDACPGKRTPAWEGDEPHENTSKVLKVRPLVHVNNGSFHGRASSHDGSDIEKQIVRHTSPSSSTPVESWQQEPYASLPDPNEEPTPSQSLKLAGNSKKGRNGNRKRGQPKAAASVRSPASVGRSASAEGVHHIMNVKDVHSEEDNDARTPEGFRDCDLETSDYCKDLSISQGSKPSKNGDIALLTDEQECQSREAHEDRSSRQDYDLAETAKDLHGSQQGHEEGSPKQNEESVEKNKGEARNSVWTGTADKKQAYVVDSQILTQVEGLPHSSNAKSILEATEHQESREPTSNNADLHFSRHHPPLANGVRGWLQNLGLGKYAQQFEAHEVDAEVLPLLTLDDLKEMGITAVGSRRKLFFAIQQLGKCLLVKAD